jgi:hypothetical protein
MVFLGQDDQVFRPIVCRIPVDVMHVFSSLQGSSEDLLHHQAMFKDVALVCPGMLRRVQEDISLCVDAASTLPVRSKLATRVRQMVPPNKQQGVTLPVSTCSSILRSEWCRLTTTALTETGRIARRDFEPTRLVHSFAGRGPTEMTLSESSTGAALLPTSAFAGSHACHSTR